MRIKKSQPIAVVVSIILLALAFGSVVYSSLIKPVDPSNPALLSFSINRGETIDSIGFRLQERGLVRSQAIFKLTVARHGIAKQIQAGQFQLSPSWDVNHIANSLTLGKDDISVTLIEGLRREEFADELSDQLSHYGIVFDKQSFLSATKNREGYLFPDTYYFPRTISTDEIVKVLLNTFEQKVDEEFINKVQTQGLTMEQAVIIASMVEREAKFDKDRPLVAGIITKRYKNDWKLQIDATVQYVLGYQSKEAVWWKQNLTLVDLEVDTPYNTYRYYGLPPGAICNPSESSLQAVANQVASKYWYYVSDGNGDLHYAETMTEHNLNIANYLGK